MAERRMFAKTIIDSDAFLDMSITARLLYYDLGMRADDDGFVNSPKKIMRMVGASEDDLRMLAARKFIIPFESGIVVIKHWKIHNYIRKDAYHETKYKEEREFLELDENQAYRLCDKSVTNPSRICHEPVTGLSTQVRLGKDRLVKDSIGVVVEAPQPTMKDYEDIIQAWNDIPHTVKIQSIIPGTKREDELRICLMMYGVESLCLAFNKIRDSKYLQKRGNVVFDRYINRNAIQGLLEGAYDKDYSEKEVPESDGYEWNM